MEWITLLREIDTNPYVSAQMHESLIWKKVKYARNPLELL